MLMPALGDLVGDVMHLQHRGVGQTLYHSLIVHYENELPVQLEDRLVNPLVAPDYLQRMVERLPGGESQHRRLLRIGFILADGENFAAMPAG
jgi:DNA-binding GntR family transcriptional regulator